jgi:hypothetical protein
MKFLKINKLLAVVSCVVLATGMPSAFAESKSISLQPVWTITGIDTPESVVEIETKHQNYFLVSAIEGDFFTKDGKGSLAKINSRGEVLDMNWVTGLNAPKGMAQFKDRVYVADLDEVVVVDLNTSKIIAKIPVPDAVFLNDVAADKKGAIFVSDTFTGRVYRLRNNQVEVYLEGVAGPNGLWAEPNRLLVGAANQLLAFDGLKQPTQIGSNLPLDIDGITPWKCGSYLISSWDGQISYMSKKGQQTLLLDSVAEGINTADIMYSDSAKLLFVPNFFHNTVSAYRVKGDQH